MAAQFSLDTSCVLNLLNPEESLDEDLIKLLRFGVTGVVALMVTDTCPREVAAAQHGTRAEVAKRAAFLPVIDIPAHRVAERNALAQDLFSTLWPNSTGSSNTSEHGRRDCEHLASHILHGGAAFVTRDDKLRQKVVNRKPHGSLRVLSPAEARQEVEDALPKPATFATQSFAVRRATASDHAALRALLVPLRADYQDFEGWLGRSLTDATTVVNLGVVNSTEVRGVAIWKPKDTKTAKLSTFYLDPSARDLGLGQHLLFHCVRQWTEKRIERAYVTASAEKEDVVSFCLTFGFRIEGAAQRRYSTGSTELVLTKQLVYQRIDDAALTGWLDDLARTVFSIQPPAAAASPTSWFVAPRSVTRTVSWDAARMAAELTDDHGHVERLGLRDLEVLFYPARLALRERPAYVVPIQPQWAERMMEIPRRQETLFRVADKLMLRIDNAYYCAPVYAQDVVDGAPIVFYVSQPESALTGMARILSRVIAEPEDLFLRFGQLGIYTLDNIRAHVARRGSQAGSAMAMHFGWWVPFKTPIPLPRALSTGLLKGHPQRMLRVPYDRFEAMIAEGGLAW